jgi:kumamolisin
VGPGNDHQTQMKKTCVIFAILICSTFSFAQIEPLRGRVVLPTSSFERPGDTGRYAHTNIQVYLPSTTLPRPQTSGPPYAGLAYETPASLACVYGLVTVVSGCSPNKVAAVPSGGSRMIAIVDAFDAPHAANDLAQFSLQFGLPPAKFQVVYASGVQPRYDMGWELEESLDIEWAHAMAPQAQIVLVEAASSSFTDLMAAEDVAARMVNAAGGGEVSNSWGSSEFSGEAAYDSHFVKQGVVFLASSGDSPGTSWPSVSPNVVAAGGTTVRRNASGNFVAEAAWEYAGGGASWYVSRPAYQSQIASLVGPYRGVPDISFDANPLTGVWIYDSNAGGWNIVGGTSVSSPAVAGILNLAGSFYTSTNAELSMIYSKLGVATSFTDISAGYCGPYSGNAASAGWDACTGVGSSKSKIGK